jgi:hypothetical protein
METPRSVGINRNVRLMIYASIEDYRVKAKKRSMAITDLMKAKLFIAHPPSETKHITHPSLQSKHCLHLMVHR